MTTDRLTTLRTQMYAARKEHLIRRHLGAIGRRKLWETYCTFYAQYFGLLDELARQQYINHKEC